MYLIVSQKLFPFYGLTVPFLFTSVLNPVLIQESLTGYN